MHLIEFTNNNKVNLAQNYANICKAGIKLMKKSKDVSHNEQHVYSLLEELDQLIKNEKNLSKDVIDFETLLTAICWHDVWKSTRDFTTKLRTHIFEQDYDGIGSYIMFKKYLKDNEIKLGKSKIIKKMILFHSYFTLLSILNPLKKRLINTSLEFRILVDLDTLDTLGLERVQTLSGKYINKGKTDPLLFRIAYFWVSKNIKRLQETKLTYSYTNRVFKDKLNVATRELVKIFKDLLDNKEYYFDTSNPNYKIIENFKPSGEDMKLIEKYSV